QLSRGVITNAQHDKERDEENDQRKHLAQKMWNGRLPLLLEIEIPKIAIDEADNDDRAEKNESGANVIAPVGLNPIDGNRGIKGEGETEKLKGESKRNVRAPLEKAAEAERHEIGKDKRGDCGNGTL